MVDLLAILNRSNWICDGLSDRVIEAGMEAMRWTEDEENLPTSARDVDWDVGMVVAFVFKAMWEERRQEMRDNAGPITKIFNEAFGNG